LEISCYRIHHYKEIKDCNQEGIEKTTKIAMDFIWEGLPDSVKKKLENVHQLKNFGISYIISTLRNLPSQIQIMLKKMQEQTRRNMFIMSDRFRRRRFVKKA
jgi:hypothetical protein